MSETSMSEGLPTAATSILAAEAAHFGALAGDWWDPDGASAMLHKLNPVRLAFLREAIERNPRSPEGWNWLSLCYACSGRTEEASAAAHRAIELEPYNVNAHAFSAWPFIVQGDYMDWNSFNTERCQNFGAAAPLVWDDALGAAALARSEALYAASRVGTAAGLLALNAELEQHTAALEELTGHAENVLQKLPLRAASTPVPAERAPAVLCRS